MSTKIYNGYKLPKMTFQELYSFTNEFRRLVQEKRSVIKYEQIIEFASRLIVSCAVSDENEMIEILNLYLELTGVNTYTAKLNVSPLSAITQIFLDMNLDYNKKNKQFEMFIYDSSLVIAPKDSGEILALYFGSRKEFQDIFESMDGVEPYYYFDNTDQPDDISDEDWKQRENDWENLEIPRDFGFIIETNNNFYPDYDILFKMIDEYNADDIVHLIATAKCESEIKKVLEKRNEVRKYSYAYFLKLKKRILQTKWFAKQVIEMESYIKTKVYPIKDMFKLNMSEIIKIGEI